MDFYERKTEAYKLINIMLDEKKSVSKICMQISIQFGLSKKFVLSYLNDLDVNGTLSKEGVKLVDGELVYEQSL